jgi:hypothetical protein
MFRFAGVREGTFAQYIYEMKLISCLLYHIGCANLTYAV